MSKIIKKPEPYCDKSMALIVVTLFTFTILSYLLWFTNIYNDQFNKLLIIKKGGYLFNSWAKPPIFPLLCVYAFNYTNTDAVLKGYYDKLQVEEVGPYCYWEKISKVNIKFHDNGTVSYNDNRTHVFVPEKSGGKEDDILITPNIPYMSAVAIVKDKGFVGRLAGFTLFGFTHQEPFTKVKAHDNLFGHENSLVTIGNTIQMLSDKDAKFEKFGLLTKRSGVSKDRITVYTGENNLELIGQVVNVNNVSQQKVWKTPECNIVSGSDGARFPLTKVTNKKPVSIYSQDSCRAISLVYKEKHMFQNQIPTYRYTIDPNHFKKPASYVNNSCYCTTGSECSYDGVFDISSCAQGAPILISQPHFLHGDPRIGRYIEGLKPDESKHDFFLDIHPRYGMTISTISRIQVNVEVKKYNNLLYMKNLPDGAILPVVWMEISTQEMPEEMFNKIWHATFSVQYIEIFLKWTCLSFYVIASVCMMRRTIAFVKQEFKL